MTGDYEFYASPYADDADIDPPPLTPTSLGDLMRLGRPDPALLGSLLYPGKMHTLTGPPESGKTILSLRWAIDAMRRGGNVLHVDEEVGLAQTAALLKALGAEPELIDKRLTYLPFPGASWRHKDLTALEELLASINPVLSIWDSCGAIMSAAGLDENSASDVSRFWGTVLMPVARNHNCCVVLIDHDAKSTEGSRYSRGSGAKLAITDVAFKVRAIRNFSRAQDGLLQFYVAKDREGFLHRNWRVKVTVSPLLFDFMHDVDESERTAGTEGMHPLAVKLASVLADEPADVAMIVRRLNEQYGHGTRWEKARHHLAELVAAGIADSIRLPGRYEMWMRAGAPAPDNLTWKPTGQPETKQDEANVIDMRTGELFQIPEGDGA